jgi:hypothetical protein
VAFDDAFADGQSNAGAGVLFAGMETLKNVEYALEILGVDANTVVAHGKNPTTRLGLGADMDLGRLFAVKLKGIGNQILEQLHELGGINGQRRQRVAGYLCAGSGNAGLKVAEGIVQQSVQWGGLEGSTASADTSEVQEVSDKAFHAGRAIGSTGNKLEGLGVDLSWEAALEEFDVAAHGTERFLKVVGSDVGELFEVEI